MSYILAALALLAALGFTHYKAYSAGEDHVQIEWDFARKEADTLARKT